MFWTRRKKPLPPHKADNAMVASGKKKSCMPNFNVTQEPLQPREWAPGEIGVKIYVASDVGSAQRTAGTVMKVQQELKATMRESHPDTRLMISVETFQDGCRHSTPWSDNPHDIGGSSTRWHCFQSRTQFHSAMQDLANESQKVDMIIMVGNHFDDDPSKVSEAAAALTHDTGAKIIALPTTSELTTTQNYEQVAKAGGGFSSNLLASPDHSDEELQALMQALCKDLIKHALGQKPEPITADTLPGLIDFRQQLDTLDR